MATLQNNIAVVLEAQGKLASALQMYQKALAVYEKVLGEDDLDTARTQNNIGMLAASASLRFCLKSHAPVPRTLRKQALRLRE